MKIEQGTVLANGATVMEVRAKPSLSGADIVVLASWPRNGGTEYITWRLDENGNAYWGHYFPYITMASQDFETR